VKFPANEYDVIVVGAGINGIACSAYLQKAGLKVALFERLQEAGAFCQTQELMIPDAKVNTCVLGIATMNSPAYEELEVERFGLEPLYSGEWGSFHPFKTDRSLLPLHNWDMKKTYDAWKSFSEKDAELLRRLVNYFTPHMSEFFRPTYEPPNMEYLMKMHQIVTDCPDLPSDLMDMTGLELADLIWHDERVKTAMLSYSAMLATIKNDQKAGTILVATVPMIFMALGWMATARGGSHALTHALLRCFLHYGGCYFPNCPVEKIIIENNEARGIVLSKHAIYPEAEIKATRAVVSNLTCKPTFEKLVGLDKMPPETIPGILAFDYEDIILFQTSWVLKEPLDWEGYPPEVQRANAFMFGIDSIADHERLNNDLASDRIPDPPIGRAGSFQGFCFADPTQAPPGHHILSTYCDVPYDLRKLGGPEKWDDIREDYGDKVEVLLSEYTPNLKRAQVARSCLTPIDYVRKNPSSVKGATIGIVPNIITQTPFMVPFPGCGAPRTPIDKLYISNSIGQGGTHLGNGYMAASTAAEDLGVREQEWWTVKPVDPWLRVLERQGIKPMFTVD